LTLGQQIAELQKLPQERVAAILAKLPEAYRLDISRYLAANKPIVGPQKGNPKQQLAYTCGADEIWYGGASKGGKGLALETPLPTPSGWTTMGAAKVGDALFDQAGNVCYVVAVSEISHRKCYRLKFNDGSEIVSDDVHRWVTFTASEMAALTRRSDEFRVKRRKSRPSNAKGNKSEAFTKAISARNALIAESQIKPSPAGVMRDTSEIARTLTDKGRNNHAIRVGGALNLPDVDLPIPPYTLGAWLGDGTGCNGNITGIDPEIFERIRQDGFAVTNHKHPSSHCIVGLLPKLRAAGVLNNKHIPEVYLRSSYRQRLELLQGLMDTDGHATIDGACEFDGINETLIDGFWELALSLGIRAIKQQGTAKLNGRVISPKFRICFSTDKTVFVLKRKQQRLKAKQSRRQDFRYIVACEEIETVPTKCISVTSPTRQFLAGRAMIPTHNSYLAAAMALNQHYRTVIFRRQYESTKELKKIYTSFLKDAFPQNYWKYVTGNAPTSIRPPTGTRGIRAQEITLASMQRPGDLAKFQGVNADCFIFDEAVQFSWGEIQSLQAWLADVLDTPKDIKPQLICTFNPPMDAAGLWIYQALAPWLDIAHPLFPVPYGQMMHRISFEGKDHWSHEPFEMTANPTTGEEFEKPIRSVSVIFIHALPTDNPDLSENTLQKLMQHPEADKLYYGNMSAALEDNPFAVVKLAAYKAMTARAAEFGRPTRKPDVLSIDPASTGDDMAIVPIWVDECYFGAPVIVPGTKIKGQVENVLHWLEHHFENSLTDYRLVIDGGGTVGGAVGQLVKQAMADKGVDASRLYMFDGSKSTKWKEYQDPDLPSANLFKPRPFLNRISAAWITLGQRGNYPNCQIKIEGHNQYQTQLCVREIKQNDVSTVRMESKEDFKDRLGRSPDAADALTMGYYFVFYELPYENYNPYTPQ